MKHIAIYCPNTIDKKQLIQSIRNNLFYPNIPNLSRLKGELYSSFSIDTYIEEELKHDQIVITSKSNQTLEEMSSGQQRLALANFICNQNFDYVILDDLQSNVDEQTLSELYKIFDKNANTCLYIQLFSRTKDLLPKISEVIEIDNSMRIVNVFSPSNFLSHHTNTVEKRDFKFPQLFSETPYFNPLITMANVTVSYDTKPVLNNVNWTIKAGEFWELRGPIGSGKTTLLAMIIGDNPKAFGQDIYLFGRKKGSGESIWDIKKHIGYFYPKMMQLFSRVTSVENMLISGFYDSIGLYTTPTDLQCKKAKEWLQVLGPSYNNNFQKLSPAQQRIVMVIRALIKQPPLLILDEPTVGLDDYNVQLFISLLHKIIQTKKIAVIFVSHQKETNLKADYILELQPTEQGSISKITKHKE